MPFGNDVTVSWGTSPRIVEVAAPSVVISLQDLHDTLRVLAAGPVAMAYDEIISSAGKEELDESTLVGLTVQLLNAKLKFEARGGPAWVPCIVSGGNLVAADAWSNPMNPIEPSAYTQVTRALSSSATISRQELLMMYVKSLL